jgi:type VI secretion system secreted protein VgrG
MAENYLQENRYLFFQSGLGPNELLLGSFAGTEAISSLFSFRLDLFSENPRIKFEDILGKAISFGMLRSDRGDPRCVHGIVTSFTQLPGTHRLSRYQAVVSPKLWVLTRKQNSRIFQQLSVPDILKKVLAGFDISWELHASYKPREYCVQYRETDFNFVSRLMEDEGIYYFFKHTKNAHKMVIADMPVSHVEHPDCKSISYDEIIGGGRDEAHVHSWIKTQELGSGKYSLRDYCYGIPADDMAVEETVLESAQVGKVTHRLKVGGNDQFEIYDYPGGYGICGQDKGERNAGRDIAKRGIQRLEMSQFLIQGESNSFALTSGYKINLRRHKDADGSYVLTRVTHSGSEGGFHSESKAGENHYSNAFECIPVALPYRPARKALKPQVQGCQTALVVGPSGESIFTDKFGRIKVQFHWDREGNKDASSSCWIRVSTLWAGEQWGMIHLPRIGQEVIVDFLEGDPDCPIVIGSVYNGKNNPPYELPFQRTQSGIKSRSDFGDSEYFNEIRFDDRLNHEEIYIHAQKDMNVEVENDQTVKIDHYRKTTIGDDDSTSVGGKSKTDAGSEIVLETGLSKIVMKSSGDIEISGVNIAVKASATIKSEATATHTIKGAIVNIN